MFSFRRRRELNKIKQALPKPPAIDWRASRRRDQSYVHSFDELALAISSGQVQITLGGDIVADEDLVISSDIAINFNGYSIVSERTASRVFDIRHGSVTLTGTGNVFAMGKGSNAVRLFGAMSSSAVGYTTLYVDEHVHLYAPEGTGIFIAPNLGSAYGVTVNLFGRITAATGISVHSAIRGDSDCQPHIYIKDSATITTDDTSGVAILASGQAKWRLGPATLEGRIGIQASHGDFRLAHTNISTKSVAILLDTPTGSGVNFHITGGSYVSQTNLTILGNPDGIDDFFVEGGDFCGPAGIVNVELLHHARFTSGNFYNDPIEFADRELK